MKMLITEQQHTS